MNIKLENLEINGYMIYQDKDSFNFGIDAVLLANFTLRNLSKVSNVCDLCAGTIPIPLIVYAKREMLQNRDIKITSFEINKNQCNLANDSIKYNAEHVDDASGIESDIDVINDDIKNIYLDKDKYKDFYDKYDAITCNPPYIKNGSGIINTNNDKLIARHEIMITFDEICRASSLLLKSHKSFFIIHHSERIIDLERTLKKYSFEIKKLQFIYPYVDKMSNLVLIEAVKDANIGVKVLEPIIIYEKNGDYTERILEIYGK